MRAEVDAEEMRAHAAAKKANPRGDTHRGRTRELKETSRKISKAVAKLPAVLSTAHGDLAKQVHNESDGTEGASAQEDDRPAVVRRKHAPQLRPRTVDIRDLKLQDKAVHYRAIGYDYPEIARRLLCTIPEVEILVRGGIERVMQRMIDDAPAALALELTALAKLQVACWAHARKGSTDHVNAILRIIEVRSKLLGIGNKVRVEHSGPGGAPLAESRLVTLARLAGADLDRGPIVDVGSGTGQAQASLQSGPNPSESIVAPPAEVIAPPSNDAAVSAQLDAAIRGYRGS